MDSRPQGRGFQPGHVIADKYELEALVGEGGMGSVWRARHRQLESAVAIKLMSPAIASQPEALNRFLREARAAARLSSLHVVKVFDFGVDGDTPFIAMELLQGESLRERLDRASALSPAATLWVIRQAARALSKAHAEGIVHRDLKPENLFITQQEDELLKVLDFGVAKLAGGGAGQPSTSTRTGALLGTPFYMSPEQARGIKAVDHRSDIWSLGVIGFECITGRQPFYSEAFGDLVLKICTLPAPVPSSIASVPAGFDAWFARATERDPELRFPSVDALVEGLQAVIAPSGEPSSAPLTPVAVANTERAPRLSPTRTDVTASQSLMAVLPRRGWGRRSWLLLALAGLAGSGALLLALARDDGPRAARPATRGESQPPGASPAGRSGVTVALDAPGAAGGGPAPSVARAATDDGEPAAAAAPPAPAEPAVEPPAPPAPAETGTQPQPGTRVEPEPERSAEPEPEPTPAAQQNAAATPSPVSRSAAPAAAPRARKPAPRSTPRPPAPAEPAAQPSRGDLFSDPN